MLVTDTASKPIARNVIASPLEIVEEARNGRMFILVDDEDRENEGDLVIPAQLATPDKINFMATHGRGLICLALTRSRVEELGLTPMSIDNRTRHETAFTVSIEARQGVSTGISAADRARTIAVAVNASYGRDDLVTPGHVFPLTARDGGVLVRAGHTEAAVDVSRLAGLNPSGVICEIMNDDGTMARLDDLVEFARVHDLKIGTIRDLIAFRLRHDHLIERSAEMTFDSVWGGDWKAITFRNKISGYDHLALQKGDIDPAKPTLVRMHTLHHFIDIFGQVSGRRGFVAQAMELIAAEGAGVIVIVNRRGAEMVTQLVEQESLARTQNKQEAEEQRDYGLGAQILAELGVQDMVLLTNTRQTLVGLEGFGLSIVGERPIPG